MRLRAGRELLVVDVSNTGVLVEASARLLPGIHVDVHVVTADGRRLVRSRVVRAYVCHLDAEAVRYRGALAFEAPVDTACVGYDIPEVLAPLPLAPGNAYPDGAPAATAAADQRLSA